MLGFSAVREIGILDTWVPSGWEPGRLGFLGEESGLGVGAWMPGILWLRALRTLTPGFLQSGGWGSRIRRFSVAQGIGSPDTWVPDPLPAPPR